MKKIYINTKNASNKFWSYEIKKNNQVEFTWGRIGGKHSELTKTISSNSLDNKVRSKLNEGYKLVTNEEFEKEKDIAKKLGLQYKLSKMEWVSKKNNTLTITKEYNPNEYVYIEILNSNNKSIECYLLSDKVDYYIDVSSKTKKNILISNYLNIFNTEKIDVVKEIIRELARKVAYLSTVKFGGIGVRKLFDNSETTIDKKTHDEIDEIINKCDKNIAMKFAGLGVRKLQL